MKGKIILTFAFALLALTLVGFVGQNTLTQLIVSIKKESQPNQKLIALKEVLNDLAYAENSVRTYTITRETESLTPFYESISTIDNKLSRLYDLTKNKRQLVLIDSMDILIEKKYGILKQLIDIKKDQNTEQLLERVLYNIDKLREKESTPNLIVQSDPTLPEDTFDKIRKVEIPQPKKEEKKSIFQRIFGGGDNKTETDNSSNINRPQVELAEEVSASDSLKTQPSATITSRSNNDLNSSDIGLIISKIGQENSENLKAVREQELGLTLRDNNVMFQIQGLAAQFGAVEEKISVNRAQKAQKATDKALLIISIIWVVALITFAILLFVIIHDITRNKKNRQRLRKAKERAEKLAKVKEEFLANMSHEIRTPLTSIIGYTEQLEHTSLNPTQRKYLQNIHHSGGHLLTIINDILDYAKMESGQLILEKICFNIHKNIESVVDTFANQVKQKNISLTYHIAPDVPVALVGDPVRFRQVLINLISNAIKFTPTGEVNVTVSTLDSGDDQLTLRLKVIDTGIGIPENKLRSIFKNFAQADSSTTRKYGGTGLGLSIVNKIVDLHAGKINVESEEGKGTAFIIDIPYKIGHEDELQEAGHQTTICYKELAGKRIMVVDDQEFNLELLQVIFDKWNIQSTLHSCGKEAITDFETNQYDMIFMDVQMPGMSGFEVTRQMRELENSDRPTPIIALTAAASQEEADQCLEAGMDDYLLKPFTQTELINKIHETLGIEQPNTPSATKEEKDEHDQLDISDLRDLSNGNPAFVVNMLNIFIKNFDIDLAELQNAHAEQSWDKIRGKSHKMIPPCRHLGFNALVATLKDIETKAINHEDMEEIGTQIAMVSNNYAHLRPIIESEIINIAKEPTEVTI